MTWSRFGSFHNLFTGNSPLPLTLGLGRHFIEVPRSLPPHNIQSETKIPAEDPEVFTQ
jgi:hypothetical protein